MFHPCFGHPILMIRFTESPLSPLCCGQMNRYWFEWDDQVFKKIRGPGLASTLLRTEMAATQLLPSRKSATFPELCLTSTHCV